MEYKFIQAVIQAQSGSVEAFNDLYSRSYKGICVFAESLLKDKADVDRVVSDTFTEAFNGIAKLSSPENFEEVLYSTAAVKCFDILGGTANAKAEIENYASGYEPFVEGVEIFPESCISNSDFLSKTEDFMAGCSPAVKTAAFLFYYISMPFVHISALLDCNESTVAEAISHFNEDLTNAVKSLLPEAEVSENTESTYVLTIVFHKLMDRKEAAVSGYNSLYQDIMRRVNYTKPPMISDSDIIDAESIEILAEKYEEQVEQAQKSDRIKDNLFSALVALGIIVALVVAGLVVKSFLGIGKKPNTPTKGTTAVNTGYFWSTVALNDISDVEPLNGDIAAYTDASTGLKGLINGKGKKILAAQYAKIVKVDVAFNYYIICVYEKADSNEMYIVDSSYTFVSSTPTTQIPYRNSYVWDNERNALMEITASGESAKAVPTVDSNVNELFGIKDKNNLYGMVNGKFALVIPPKYEAIGEYSEGLIAAKLNGKWGYIDLNADVVIPFMYDAPIKWEDSKSVKYERTLKFKKGMTAVRKDGKVGVIDTANNVIVDFNYDDIVLNEENCFIALRDNKWGLLNINESIMPTTVNRGVTTQYYYEDETTLPQTRSYTVTTSGDLLNIRASALAGSALVGTIPNGTIVTGSVEKNGWVYLTYKGKAGWVNASYLIENVTYTFPSTIPTTVPTTKPVVTTKVPVTPTTTRRTWTTTTTQPKTTLTWRDRTTPPTTTTEPSKEKININTADIYELMTLYGVGEDLAQAIVDYRESNGPFKDTSEITKVNGVNSVYAMIRDKITV